jgi:hypothetical protein
MEHQKPMSVTYTPMANAPEIENYPYPEALPHKYDASSGPECYYPPSDQSHYDASEKNKILGLKRRAFWILTIAIMVISAAVIGGSVGGSLAIQKSR